MSNKTSKGLITGLFVAFTLLFVAGYFYTADLLFGVNMGIAPERDAGLPFVMAFPFYFGFGLAIVGPALLLFFMRWNIVLHAVLIPPVVLAASIVLGPEAYDAADQPLVVGYAAAWAAINMLAAWRVKLWRVVHDAKV